MLPADRILAYVAALPRDISDTLISMKREMGGRRKLSFTVHEIDGAEAIAYRLDWARRLRSSGLFTVELREYDYGFYVCARPNDAFWIWRNASNLSEIPNKEMM